MENLKQYITEGGPWFPQYRFFDYHKVWKDKLIEMMNTEIRFISNILIKNFNKL